MPYALALDLHAPNQVKGNKAGRGSIYTISFFTIPPWFVSMASPLGDQTESKFPDSIYQSIRSHFSDDLAAYLDIQQLFILIDGVLPFEACLYYQVLPLYVDSNRLILGIVNPNDASAMDYVRRIISYHKYRPVAHKISSEAMQAVLSAYLNYSGSQARQQANPGNSQSTRSPRSAAQGRSQQRADHNAQPTYIVDSPEDLNVELPEGFLAALPPPPLSHSLTSSERPTLPIAEVPDNASPQIPILLPLEPRPLEPAEPMDDIVASLLEVAEDQNQYFKAKPFKGIKDHQSAPLPASPSLPSSAETRQVNSQSQPPEMPQSPDAPLMLLPPIPPLDVQLNYLNQPMEVLARLAPSEFLKELLGRVLVGGIGRLYFERQPRYGHILWSQDGVLKSIVEQLDLQRFQATINELKLLAHLSLVPVSQSRQVDSERLYERTRILLRFRFIPTPLGEEATIQILRGAALKFYQQQQLSSLERDALGIARQLQTKLNEIRDRARSESGAAAMRLEALPALSQILKNIEAQVDHMQPPADQPPLE